ncbi:MAG: G8 domain-containing protein [Planctomycetota bacterium]
MRYTIPRTPLSRTVVLLSILGSLGHLQAQEIHSTGGGGNWSATSSWVRISGPGGGTPTSGDHVIVTAGNPVTLDVPSVVLSRLEIHDQFSALDTQAYRLLASRIDVGGPSSNLPGQPRVPGQFTLGSAATPFLNQFKVRLTGDYLSSAYAMGAETNENKSLIVHGGSTFALFGRSTDAFGQPRQSWLRLQQNSNASAGMTSIALETRPGWMAGDVLVVAPTDFLPEEVEVVRCASVSSNVAQLTSALTHYHHTGIERGLVDERAEVGLLTHNICIESEVERTSGGPNTCPPAFGIDIQGAREDVRGGHVMFHNRAGMDPAPIVQVDHVEFTNLGWKGALGRYPVHFHLLGNTTGNFVRDCSIHHCFNRSISVHGTNGVTIEGNVAHDTYGHAFYFEDKSEVDNRLLRNLGTMTRVPTPPVDPGVCFFGQTWSVTGKPFFCLHDREVSTYWLTNTDNEVSDNVAAGSERHGFWLDTSPIEFPDIIFLAASLGVTLSCDAGFGLHASLPGIFDRNVAHSNRVHGFWNDATRLAGYDPSLPQPLAAEHVFNDFTAYKNANSGIWTRGYGTHRWVGARIADNRLGVYLASEGFQLDGMAFAPTAPAPFVTTAFDNPVIGVPSFSVHTLEGSVIIGESSNAPTTLPDPNRPYLARKGIVIYDGQISILGTDFYDFVTVPITNFVNPAPPAPAATPTLTHRVAMGVTSYTQHAYQPGGHPWSVDPRNLIAVSTFTNCSHPVLFPIPHGPSVITGSVDAPPGTATSSPNGIIATSLFDVDGSVPGSAPNTYLAINTPLMRPAGIAAPTALPFGPYAQPMSFGGPGSADNDAIAQILVSLPVPHPAGLYSLTFDAINRGNTLEVFDALSASPAGALKRFPTNILMTRPGAAEEVYELSYPSTAAGLPTVLDVRLQFAPMDRTAVLRIPYPSLPNSIVATNVLLPGSAPAWPQALTQADFNAGLGWWFFDSMTNMLHLRIGMFDGAIAGFGLSPILPMFSGREITLKIS